MKGEPDFPDRRAQDGLERRDGELRGRAQLDLQRGHTALSPVALQRTSFRQGSKNNVTRKKSNQGRKIDTVGALFCGLFFARALFCTIFGVF